MKIHKCLKIKLPIFSESNDYDEIESDDNKRLNIFRDYKEKLENLFPQIRIIAFDPDFLVEFRMKYDSGGNVLKERWDGGESLSLYMAHLILRAHQLHNPDIEIWE